MLRRYLSLVKFAHTIFALPFAILGFMLGMRKSDITIDWSLFFLMILCMVFARSAAMAFNRYLDRDIDALNTRTAGREIPAGKISAQSALVFIAINCLLFIATTFFINPLCFFLSPVALLVILGYSYMKRISWTCHFVLGLGLGLAPIGAYLTAGGGFDPAPLLYSFAVMCWVAGFDIIYALQDEEFDRQEQLHSIPQAFGKEKALLFSRALHVICALVLTTAAYVVQTQYPEFGLWLNVGTVAFITLLFYQHSLVKPYDLSKVNMAFFTTNGIASIVLSLFFVIDLFV